MRHVEFSPKIGTSVATAILDIRFSLLANTNEDKEEEIQIEVKEVSPSETFEGHIIVIGYNEEAEKLFWVRINPDSGKIFEREL